MFSKTFKIKSTNTLKNTEKKQLASKIQANVNASEEKAKELVPTKSNTSCMKVMLHSGELVSLYVVDNYPIIIEGQGRVYPTVCALWKVPDLLPMLTIHMPVLSKLQNGVPLYLPGVEPSSLVQPFVRGAIIAVNTDNNASAAAVGIAAMDSTQIITGQGGVAMEPIHVFGDYLCKESKFNKIERPLMQHVPVTSNSITYDLNQLSLNEMMDTEFPPLVPPPPLSPSLSPIVDNAPQIIEAHSAIDDCGEYVMEEVDVIPDLPTDMDGLLKYSLLTFIKCESRKVALPLKTNLLYRNYLIQLCPSRDVVLDVKKSSYKKVGKFLDAMQKEGLLEMREIEKGVDAITNVNMSHEDVKAHIPHIVVRTNAAIDDTCDYVPPQVREMYCVTAAVLQLFSPIKKGTPLTVSHIRETLTYYVKSNNLQTTNGQVNVNAFISGIIGKKVQEKIKWDELMSLIHSKMTACTQMTFADGTVRCVKTKLEPIKMQVATRSSNKKVTLVSNLESFGLSLSELCKVCQVGVAASCSVTRTPGAKFDQLLLQGDQTYFMAKLLIEKYGIPKKYVEGADKALKKKNK